MINLITDLINFTQPTNLDKESLSVIESIAKIKKVVNECIAQFNNLEDKTEEDYIKFKNDITNYKNELMNKYNNLILSNNSFKNEFKELINNIKNFNVTLDYIKVQSEFVQQLAKINADAIKDGSVATKTDVEEITGQVINLKRNRIFNCPVYGNPTCYSNDKTVIDRDIDKLVKIGVDGVILTIRTNLQTDNVSIEMTQTEETLQYIYNKCIEKKLNVIAVRVSASSYNNSGYDFGANWETWKTQYTTILTKVIELFKNKNIPYFYPFNETEKIMLDYVEPYTAYPYINSESEKEDYVIECLELCKNNGFTSGVNVGSFKYLNFITPKILDKCDIVAVNNYIQIGTNAQSMSVEDVTSVINEYVQTMSSSFYSKFNGKIFINECGCKSYWESLISPALWDFSSYKEIEDGKPIELYWTGIFNSCIQNIVEGVGMWFHEDIKDNNIQFFNRYIGRYE